MKETKGTFRLPNEAEIKASFKAESCQFSQAGWSLLEGCNTRSFGPLLGAFFLNLQKSLGRPVLRDFFQILRKQSCRGDTWSTCSFKGSSVTVKPVRIRLGSISGSLRELRESLISAFEQNAFDKVFAFHGLSKVSAMDALFGGPYRKTLALYALSEENSEYAARNHCAPVLVQVLLGKKDSCAVECH